MQKKNVVRMFGLFALAIMTAVAGMAYYQLTNYRQVLSSPPLGATDKDGKQKIYKIKMKKKHKKKKQTEILEFSPETAKILGIDGGVDYDADLKNVASEKGDDDYTMILRHMKKKPLKKIESDYDMQEVLKELEMIKSAEKKAAKAEERRLLEQRRRENQALLRRYEKNQRLEKRYTKGIRKEIRQKYSIEDVDYEYEGLIE